MIPVEAAERQSVKLPRVLGPVEALCVVVGSVIGSGIFLVPATVADHVPFMGGIVLVWVVGGLFSGAGALTLAELGAMLPQAGGLYVFLRVAYGALPAFLFGWVEFLVVRSGSMATLAAAFARYFSQLAPAPAAIPGKVWQAGAAVLAIAVVTTVNVLGHRRGGGLQVVGTALKVGGIAVMMVLPFALGAGTVANFSPALPTAMNGSIFLGMMTAMVSVLWAYDGWTNITPLAEEIRDPGRNIPRALILGMAVLIAVYLGMTLAYHYVIPMNEIRKAAKDSADFDQVTAAVYCEHLLGRPGVVAISILVMISTFISLNGNALSGPRAYFAMARRSLPGRPLPRQSRFQTPANAIVAQGTWAILLTIAGTLLVMVPRPRQTRPSPNGPSPRGRSSTRRRSMTCSIPRHLRGEHLLHAGDSQRIRAPHRRPDLPRPYRTLGYPLTPLLYVAASLLLLGNMLVDVKTRVPSLVGLGIIVLGVPAYAFFRRSYQAPDAG